MKKYVEPECNVLHLNMNDVIATSGCTNPPETPEDPCGMIG